MEVLVTCTQTNPQRQISAQGTDMVGVQVCGAPEVATELVLQCPELCLTAVAQ